MMERANLVKVAWLSVLLGLGMELALVTAAAGFGKFPGVNAILADTVQKVSWAFIVCTGLAVGIRFAKAREAAMGSAGLLAGPIGFSVARALHKSATQALGAVGPTGGVPTPMTMAALKAVEYAWLGVALACLAKRKAGVGAYAGIGLVTGAIFAGLVIWLSFGVPAEPPMVSLVSKGMNELLFPVGCSLVIFAAEAAGRKVHS